MTINMTVKGVQELAKKLDPIKREQVLLKGMDQSGLMIQHWIMKNRLSAPPGYSPVMLHVITNRLRSSITTSPSERSGNSIVKKIGTNVVYAAIHEFGGTIHRYPRSNIFVQDRYVRGSKKGMFKKVPQKSRLRGQGFTFGAYDINIPARPFMRPSIEDPQNQREVLRILSENLQEALNE